MSKKTDLVFLTLILVIANIPYWLNSIWPQHDTIYTFQKFYIFYNNWFLNHELTRWLPFSTYGIQADQAQLDSLSAISYLVGWAAGLLKVQNVLWLFKFSILIEQWFFLTGMYFLSNLFFQKRTTIWFVCLTSILSTVWLLQIYWNFRIYYFLPLTIYFFAIGFRFNKSYLIWLGILILAASLLGNPPYFAMLYLLIGTILIFYAWMIGFIKLSYIRWSSKDFVVISILFIFCSVYFYFLFHMFDGIYLHESGRDLKTHVTPLSNFLEHGGELDIANLSQLFLGGANLNHTSYIGLLPLIFVLYGIFKVKRPGFFAALAIAVLLYLLSLGDQTPIARLIYYFFPPMRWFRYIAHVKGIAKIFLIFASGFGLDEWLNRPHQRNNPGAYKYLSVIILLLVILDLVRFQFSVLQEWPNRWEWVKPEAYHVRAYEYQRERILTNEIPEPLVPVFKVVSEPAQEKLTLEALNFSQIEFCYENFMLLYQPRNVFQLLTQRAAYERINLENGAYVEFDVNATLSKALGCHSSKLRLHSNVLFAENSKQAERLIQTVGEIDKILILEKVPKKIQTLNNNSANETSGNLQITKFTPNKLEFDAEITSKQGAWVYNIETYHPGWKARVNGKQADIYKANLAFRAIRLNSGRNHVRLNFFDGWQSVAGIILAVFGILFSIGLFVIIHFVHKNFVSFTLKA